MSISGKNISKGGNVAFVPSAYRLEFIEMTNYKGEVQDIQNIAVKMSITESIYTQSLVLSLTLKDSTNFIEEFPIIGEEKIRVKISYKKRNGKDKSIDLKFFVTEYPIFGSSENQAYVQIIRLMAISEQSYISNQKKISRTYSNNTAKEIQEILKRDLNLPDNKFKTTIDPYLAISSSKGIINRQRPMDVIEWFRKQTYDQYQSPFFLYQTLNGKYKLYSLASMTDDNVNRVFDTYIDRREGMTIPSTGALSEEEYRQRETTIISVSSDLKLNKSVQSRRGAFASRNNFLDYSNKSYTTIDYNYDLNFLKRNRPTLENKSVISNQFKIGDNVFTDFNNSHCEYISLNSKSFPETSSNYNNMSKGSRQFLNAYNSLFNTITHDITLNGNFKLNAGRKIELVFPKSIDPFEYRKFSDGKDPQGHINKFLSGKYIITSAIHEFENDEYYVNLRVKRDSFSVDL